MARQNKSSALISACLPLISTDVPRLLKRRLTTEQLKEVLRLPSIKSLGGEQHLRLVASWMDNGHAATTILNRADQLDSLLPLVDLRSINEASFLDFMRENTSLFRIMNAGNLCLLIVIEQLVRL